MSDYFIHTSSFVETGAQIGAGTHIWFFCHIMAPSKIGKNCNLGQNVMIGKNVTIGNHVKIQNNVSVYEGVELQDDVFIGPSVVFTNVINPRSFIERKAEFKSTIVEHGATLGANATIICGITIGAYALIGAGAVVSKSVLPFALVVGNPAKQIGWVSKAGHKLQFDEKGFAICPETQEKYILKENLVNCID